MRVQLETTKRRAFDLVTDALECIDQYRRLKDLSILETAKQKLVSAISEDPTYVRATYVDGIVDDLSGRSVDAVNTFSKLLAAEPPFLDELRYNLGVAEYHGYNHEALDRAIELFTLVRDTSGEPSLQLLARAGLAQSHAMHMIPKVPAEPDLLAIQRHFDMALSESSAAIQALNKNQKRWFSKKSKLRPVIASEIEWTARNARGMAMMYYTDYLPSETDQGWRENRIHRLRQAMEELDLADSASPSNWANYCDMASARLRLGYYEQSTKLWQEAVSLLDTVVRQLRPGYAFAQYEKGRVLRLWGRFDEAATIFEHVMTIPYPQQRDISDRRPKLELDRARRRDPSFP